jgi:hypothetical protein
MVDNRPRYKRRLFRVISTSAHNAFLMTSEKENDDDYFFAYGPAGLD